MENDKSKLISILKVLAGITIIVVVILFIISYQIGVEGLKDQTNRSTIISGLLSMMGGTIGAFGAYFIAKWQMTVLLERQDEKDRKKITWEININKKQEALQILNNNVSEFQKIKDEYIKYITEIIYYLKKHNSELIINTNALYGECMDKIENCLNSLNEFENTYQIIFSYKPFVSKDFIRKIENFKQEYGQLRLDLFEFLHLHNHKKDEYPFEEFKVTWLEEKEKMTTTVTVIGHLLKKQVNQLELELFEIMNIK